MKMPGKTVAKDRGTQLGDFGKYNIPICFS